MIKTLRILTVLLFAGNLWASNDLTVNLKDRVFINSSKILLGQIADFSSGDSVLYNRLKSSQIARLNYSQSHLNLKSAAVKQAIASFCNTNLNINGKACIIRYNAPRIPYKTIMRVTQNYFDSIFTEQELKVTEVRYPDLFVPVNSQIELSAKNKELTGNNIKVKGKIIFEDQCIRNFALTASVTTIKEVYVLNKSYKRKQIIRLDDLSKVKKGVKFNGSELTNIEAINNIVAARYLPSGSILTALNTKNIPDVKRGQVLTVSLNKGKVALNIPLKASKDAMIGETIAFKNPKNNQRFEAKIITSNFAVINLGD